MRLDYLLREMNIVNLHTMLTIYNEVREKEEFLNRQAQYANGQQKH